MKTLNIFIIAVLLSAILFTQYAAANLSGTGLTPQNPADLNPPIISYTPLINTNSTGSRTLTATITDSDGVPTTGIGLPVLYWKIDTGSWNSATGTFIGGNNYQFTFGGGVVVADIVYYYIVAQDSAATPTVGAFPSGGAGGFTANPPAAATPPTFPSNYTVTYSPLSGDITVGLTAFNRIMGKHITFEKVVKKVVKNVFVQEINSDSKSKSGLLKVKQKSVTVEQVDWIPMENGKKYNGPLHILKSEHPEFSFPMNINGVYATITGAVSDLNFRGVGGVTRLLLDDASYTTGESYPIVINIANENMPSSTNTISIKPNTGVTTSISTSSDYIPVFRILSNYFTIDGSNSTSGTTRDLTISNTSTLSPEVIAFTSLGTTPITGSGVINCNLINGINTSTAVVMTDFSFSGGYFNGIAIQNNSIQKSYYGIYGTSVTALGTGSGLNISGNDLNSIGSNAIRYCGIYIQGFNGAIISGNNIANFDNTDDELDNGIWVDAGNKNTVIEKNKIYNLGYGGSNGYCAQAIKISSGNSPSNITISNNVIYNIYGVGYDYVGNLGNNPMAIYLYGTQSGISIFNNSINLYGNTLNLGLAMSIGICLGAGSSADVRNNNIVNTLGLAGSSGYGSCAIYAQGDNTQFTDIDFNNYYVNPTGTGVAAIGKFSTTITALTLSDWATATGKDIFSITADPGFTSPTNLQPDVNNVNSWNVNAGAFPLSAVSTDINGNPRSTSVTTGAIDIGAYEFTPVVSSGNLTISGSIADNGNSIISFAGTTLATITWHANGGTLPTTISAVFEPGVNPPNAGGSSLYANENLTITVPDGSGYLYDIVNKYNLARQGTISSESLFRIAKYSSSVWTQFTSTPNTTDKTIAVTGLNSFSTFSFGDGNAPLPVNFSSFTSNVSGRNVILKWTTASENNNSGFDILRTAQSDKGIWTKVGFVAGNKTKTTPSNYSFEDRDLNSGKYNYKLKQVDYNGNYTYFNLSNVVEVGIPVKYDISQNYPNPFNPVSKIDFSLPFDSKISIKLYDMTGREVLTLANEQRPAGYYTVQINGVNLASGVYFYRLIAEGNGQKIIMTKKAMLIK